jgi:cytochrome c-type biogenesis protein CcmF
MWKPLATSIVVLIALLATGMRNIGALLGLWLCGYVFLVTVYEFFRGTRARVASKKENFAMAFWHLVARNRRRYGGYVIHLGVVLIAIGVIGIEFFQQETQGSLAVGEHLTLGAYSIEYESLAEFQTADGRLVDRAVVNLYKDGELLRQLFPRRDFYFESQQPMNIPGLYSTLESDVYIRLVDWEPLNAESATFKVYLNPLVNWVWMGGIVFILGTLVAAWPDREIVEVAERPRSHRLAAEVHG